MSISINEILHYSSDLTMLYVEDDDNIREHTFEILEDFFQKVLVAKDGEEGLQKFLSYKKIFDFYPDIIITDIRMPKLDGIEMCRKIFDVNEDQMVIVSSAHNDSDKLIELIDIGIYAFLLKPLQPTQIYKTLYKTSRKVHLKKNSKIHQNRLIEKIEKLEETNRIKDNFLIEIAHKIKAPTHIAAALYGSFLASGEIESRSEYQKYIEESTKQLLETVDNLLYFSQMEAGALRVEHINFSLNTLLDYIFDRMSQEREKSRIKLLFDIDKSVPVVIKGDPLHLSQVIINLIENRIKYTIRGAILLKIALLSDELKRESLRFEISNSGETSPNNIKERSLELDVAQQLIALMGGSMHAISDEGVVSKFIFTVAVESMVGRSQYLSSHNIVNKNILIIDNDAKVLSTLGDMLKFFQSKIYYASDIGSVELLMRDNSFDVIFIDKKFIEHCDKGLIDQNQYAKIVMLERDAVSRKKRVYGGIYIDMTMEKSFDKQIVSETIYGLFGNSNDLKLKKDDLLTLKGSRILLVEESSIHQAVVSGLLQDTGIDVVIASTPIEAYEQIDRFGDFEIIFVEMAHHEKVGTFMGKYLKYSSTPIIGLYAHNEQIDVVEKSLLDGVLSKPINVSEFYSYLLKYIQPKVSSFDIKKSQDSDTNLASIQTIEVLDRQRGLAYTAGNNELYSNILRDFLNKYRGLSLILKELIEQKEYTKISQILYNLKKKSGHIGALKLLDTIIALEEVVGQDSAKVGELLERYRESYEALSLAIDDYLNERKMLSNQKEILTDTRLFELLSEIYIQAKKRRALPCKELAVELESYQWSLEYQEQLDTISSSLKKYKFKDAIAAIEEIV